MEEEVNRRIEALSELVDYNTKTISEISFSISNMTGSIKKLYDDLKRTNEMFYDKFKKYGEDIKDLYMVWRHIRDRCKDDIRRIEGEIEKLKMYRRRLYRRSDLLRKWLKKYGIMESF